MKTKRFLLTLATMIGMTGAWAQDTPEEVTVNPTGNPNQWTFVMPGSEVELEVLYDRATLTDAPAAVEGLACNGEAQALITAGTASGGTLYYALGTATDAPTDENDWSTDIPTATAAGTYYVWYKVEGDETHEGLMPAGPVTVYVAQTTSALLAVTGNTGTTSSAWLMDATFKSLTPADKIKEGGKFALGVIKADGYDFRVTFSTSGATTEEFTQEEYASYIAYAKANNIPVSLATLPPLRFAQKNGGNHYIYGIGFMRCKTPNGTVETLYTDALPATVKNIPGSPVTKIGQQAAGARMMTRRAPEAGEKLDVRYVFAPEAQLTVYVDGQWSADLSDSYAFGYKATVTAPAVSGKAFAYWEADGQPLSTANPLTLTMNAHTTLRAVYDGSAAPAAGFTSVTRTNDKISFQAIADASATEAGIIYSTGLTGDALTIGGDGVTQVAAETLTDGITEMPASILDASNCWMLQIAPADETTVYHARVYATIGGNTVYGAVRDVKLADLKSGVQRIANLDGFEHELDAALTDLQESGEAVVYYSVTVTGDEIDETEAGKWTVQPEGNLQAGTEVTVSYTGDRKVKSVKGEGIELTWSAETKTATFTMPAYNVELQVVYYTQEEIDRAAADAAIAMINAIGTVEYTDACKAKIDAARAAYNALTDAQKALVGKETLKVLTDAEEEYARLAITTGIDSVKEVSKADVWYDLRGQRLSGKPTKMGIYFCNGKKVVVK